MKKLISHIIYYYKERMKRLYSIDLLRGLALAGMILVNNPGDWGNIYLPFEHAEFAGLTLADMVFPTFMFVMGFCIPLSFRRFDNKLTKDSSLHVLKRTLMIFAIGLFLQWMSSGWCEWSHLRIPGVLQRLAISYGIAAIIFLSSKRVAVITVATIILVGYGFVLYLFNGFEWSEANIISRIDHYLLGAGHLYVDNGIRLDPEGIFSTLPSIAHVLIGASIATEYLNIIKDDNLVDEQAKYSKIIKLLLTTGFTFIMTALGLHLDEHFIVKKIWSPTFVLITIGIALCVLALLTYLVDQKKLSGWWSQFFVIFGKQPLVMYVVAWLLADWFGHWGITWNTYKWLCNFFSPCTSSLLYALFFVMVNWGVAFLLSKISRTSK